MPRQLPRSSQGGKHTSEQLRVENPYRELSERLYNSRYRTLNTALSGREHNSDVEPYIEHCLGENTIQK